MKVIKKALCVVFVIIICLCSSCSKIDVEENILKVGVLGLNGNYSPLYAQSEADKSVMSQIYQSIQRRISDNSLVNNCGGISYEYVGDNQVKYTVSIRDDLVFSDGNKVTIDDIIFFYHLIADATYDGVYSDWYLNDIVGLKEYYFDSNNYIDEISSIENIISSEYTATNISKEDYVEFLVATELSGRFNESVSPSGKPWSEYFDLWGYSAEFALLGAKPDRNALLKMAAESEAENNPLSYSPEAWFREQLYAEYVADNYSDGINVNSISGISKINDYSCSILFNSRNINAVSQVNAFIVSEDYYSLEYVKGQGKRLRELSSSAVSSGAYVISSVEDNELVLKQNEFYSEPVGFNTVKFIDYSNSEKKLYQAFLDGEIDVAKTTASSRLISSLDPEKHKYYVSDCDYYVSLFANPLALDYSQRKSLLGLCDVNELLNLEFGSYYNALFMPLSVRFPEYPENISEPVYSRSAFTAHKLAHGAPINNIDLYYSGSEADIEYVVIENYKQTLLKDDINLIVHLTDEAGVDKAIKSGDADLWVEKIYDGPTCDKFDYFNSAGLYNKTLLASEQIDALTQTVRSSVGFADRSAIIAELLNLVMNEAVEFPIYQLQDITLYNLSVISPLNFNENFNYDGYNYALWMLKSN